MSSCVVGLVSILGLANQLPGRAALRSGRLPAGGVRCCQDAVDDAALTYGTALSALWRGESDRLETLSASCRVQTPLWKCDDRAAYESELLESRKFYSALGQPSLTVLSHRQLPDGRAQLTWMVGVEWPAVWRPRVNILGESTLTLGADGLVTAIVEEWHQKPVDALIEQVLPKFRDIASLWCTPTAEHLPLPVIGQGDGFELRRVPPMRCLCAEWVEVGSQLLVDQAPIPPYYAFSGGIKRTDWYNAVSPGFVERSFTTWQLPGGMSQTGQRRRWFAPLPARFRDVDAERLPAIVDPVIGDDEAADGGGDDDEGESLPPEIVSASVEHTSRPAQLLAVRALKEIPSNDAVLKTALELTERAEAAGYRVVKEGGRPVVMQISGDVKYGFNDKVELALSVWLSVPNALREEYVGVVIDESQK